MPNKSTNLSILQKNNFLVPDFITVSPDDIFMDKIQGLDTKKTYAIRSDMQVEDSTNMSFAGQFQTFIDIDFIHLIPSIKKVIHHAQEYGLDTTQISVIIQEYIVLDYAGIAFSRSPFGGREMSIEYHKGIGEDIVSGHVTPETLHIFHNETDYKTVFMKLKHVLSPDAISDFISHIKKIESIFGFPQDIEWGISGGEIYFFQSRNITTLLPQQYEEILYLEKKLYSFTDKKYFFTKNEVSEIAPKPCPFTLSLLEKIYSKDGPLDRFYKKYHIHLQNTLPLQLIGNDLYINKELDLKNIFPCMTYLKNGTFTLSFDSFSGSLTSLKNLFFLSFMKHNQGTLCQSLQQSLQKDFGTTPYSSAISSFFEDYSLIYEINFFTGKVFSQLEKILSKESLTFSQALNLSFSDTGIVDYNIDTSLFLGNSLDISDQSAFISIQNQNSTTRDSSGQEIWDTLPQWKQTFLRPYIIHAIFMQDLREKGRYLTVKHISHIRELLLGLEKKYQLQSLYFSTIDEVSDHHFEQSLFNLRKQGYTDIQGSTFPPTLQSHYTETQGNTLSGISSGITEGTLVNIETLSSTPGKKILLTQLLSPHLVQYFDHIDGIISLTGGSLSHLAIMAREKGIPVITGEYQPLGLSLGDTLTIDGDTGIINILDKP